MIQKTFTKAIFLLSFGFTQMALGDEMMEATNPSFFQENLQNTEAGNLTQDFSIPEEKTHSNKLAPFAHREMLDMLMGGGHS